MGAWDRHSDYVGVVEPAECVVNGGDFTRKSESDRALRLCGGRDACQSERGKRE